MNYKKEEKYQAILHASIEVILEKGFTKTSISEITKRAGVAHGTFYIYFQAKNDLIPAIAELILEKLFSDIKRHAAAGDTIWEKIQALIESTFTITQSFREVIILCYSGVAFNHSFERWEQIYAPYYQWLEGELRTAQERGEISVKITANLVKMIINSIEQAAENYYFTENHQKEHDAKGLKQEVFSFIQRAIR